MPRIAIQALLALTLLPLPACDDEDCATLECDGPRGPDDAGGEEGQEEGAGEDAPAGDEADEEQGEGEGEDDGGAAAACDPDARPPDTSMECAPGEICRHFDDGTSACADFGMAGQDHDECCEACLCIGGGTCVETVFIDYDDIPCESDADCPPAASCITRNYGNKRCAYAG